MSCAETLLLYAVTDRTWTGPQTLTQQVEAALKGGVTCVQLREKTLDEAAFLQQAVELRALCHAYGVPLIVNDNVEVALRCHADGVHIGQNDGSVAAVRARIGREMLLGVSVHTVAQAEAAVRAGADYLGVGAMFATSTKGDASLVRPETLHAICSAVSVPVVAIGGLNADTLPRLRGSGICGAALVSAIFSAPDIQQECRRLRQLVGQVAACPDSYY